MLLDMIHVFKTSVSTEAEILKIKQALDDLVLPGKWNFDLDDCDKILRVESDTARASLVIRFMQEQHFVCEELN